MNRRQFFKSIIGILGVLALPKCLLPKENPLGHYGFVNWKTHYKSMNLNEEWMYRALKTGSKVHYAKVDVPPKELIARSELY